MRALTRSFGDTGDDQPAGAATNRGGRPRRLHRPSSRCRRTQHGLGLTAIDERRRKYPDLGIVMIEIGVVVVARLRI